LDLPRSPEALEGVAQRVEYEALSSNPSTAKKYQEALGIICSFSFFYL
jgi:hypothetical protein